MPVLLRDGANLSQGNVEDIVAVHYNKSIVDVIEVDDAVFPLRYRLVNEAPVITDTVSLFYLSTYAETSSVDDLLSAHVYKFPTHVASSTDAVVLHPNKKDSIWKVCLRRLF